MIFKILVLIQLIYYIILYYIRHNIISKYKILNNSILFNILNGKRSSWQLKIGPHLKKDIIRNLHRLYRVIYPYIEVQVQLLLIIIFQGSFTQDYKSTYKELSNGLRMTPK